MQIINERPGTKAVCKLTGTTLTVGPINLDLAAEQSDIEKRIIVYGDGEGSISLEPDLRYVAVVVIPPQVFTEIEIEGDDGPTVEIEPVPLDTGTVTLHLWPLTED